MGKVIGLIPQPEVKTQVKEQVKNTAPKPVKKPKTSAK